MTPETFNDLDPTTEAELRRFGWTLSPDFEHRYLTDPWVFNLVNALGRVIKERDEARTALRAIAEPDDLLDANEGAFNRHAARRIQAQIQTAFDAAGVVATGDNDE